MATSRYRSRPLANIPQRLHSVLWIRIRIHFESAGSRRAEMTHKSEDNSGFEVLDVLF
jgi:hypothetical protein